MFQKLKILVIVSLSFASVTANCQTLSIPKFSQVNPNIFRGGRPNDADLSILKSQYGIKTIVDLENNPFVMASESKTATNLGITWIKEEMNPLLVPSDAELAEIHAILTDPLRFPIFVHCLHGEDRTGLVIGLYEVEVAQMSPAAAYQEMLSFGFHPAYTALDSTFRKKTGYSGP